MESKAGPLYLGAGKAFCHVTFRSWDQSWYYSREGAFLSLLSFLINEKCTLKGANLLIRIIQSSTAEEGSLCTAVFFFFFFFSSDEIAVVSRHISPSALHFHWRLIEAKFQPSRTSVTAATFLAMLLLTKAVFLARSFPAALNSMSY